MSAYYNEFDKFAAAWLRELIKAKLGLASGEDILAPLIEGGINRVGRLRGFGNAIVPQVAAEFIKAYLATTDSEAGSGTQDKAWFGIE